MIATYYSKGCKSNELFQGLEIAQDPTYHTHLNQYNVIFLNIQQFIRKAGKLEELPLCVERKVLDELKENYPELVRAEFLRAVKCE